MAQSSGPISQGTPAERQFTDVMWRDLFGDEPGVLGDTNGTAYALSLASDSNIATIGSASIRSSARVAGFAHSIPVGQPEVIDIPAAVGSARTDLITLRYDPAYTGAPGPVRLYRVAGSSSSIPAYDAEAPGIEELPLYAITRQPGQSLNQATVVRMFPRIAPLLQIDSNAAMPANSPIATRLRRGTANFVRALDGNGIPVWVSDDPPAYSMPAITQLTPNAGYFENWGGGFRSLCFWREGRAAYVTGAVRLLQNVPPGQSLGISPLPVAPLGGTVPSGGIATARVHATAGGLFLVNENPGATMPAGVLVPVDLVYPAA